MPHRSTGHAARRRVCAYGPTLSRFAADASTALVLPDWDATTYDDVIPPSLRGSLHLDEDGAPVEPSDLIAD